MPVTVVVGAQWGDEGKGKIVDYLSDSSDLVIRFQGGPNAGHTILNEMGEFKLHGIPSGIFRPETLNIVGAGCVVSPPGILEEIDALKSRKAFRGRLLLSDRAHIIMPYHYTQEEIEETVLGNRKIGTTGRGIGPAYSDKAGRWGIRLGDLAHPQWLKPRLKAVLEMKNRFLVSWNRPPFDLDELFEQCMNWHESLKTVISDTLPVIGQALSQDRAILLEGQLGAGKCVEYGSYPFVTSSVPLSGTACTGTGIPPSRIKWVIGVVKAYSTSVGAGPMVTRDESDIGPRLRELGHEFGATTGRPRSCGWLDGVMLAHSARLNGFTSVAVTRIDVLDTVDPIGICTGYRLDGEVLKHMPVTPVLEQCRPVYEMMPGWGRSTRDIRSMENLPRQTRAYLERIAELTGAPVSFVSVGPRREETIHCPEA
ncbi:adenylosuccinate synthase [bacterium]|nr:adenylosuccinate synthase [candidate division CSSED10-310 bacterium]